MAGINDIAKKTGVKADDITLVLGAIRRTVNEGERVQIQGFGTFKIKTRAARTSRNPRTGEPVQVEEKQVLTFKAS
jgi:nucleoid DNA-binding protein